MNFDGFDFYLLFVLVLLLLTLHLAKGNPPTA